MSLFSTDIAIDLGSCTTRVYVKDKGIVISEPTLLLVEKKDRHMVHAVGDEAYAMLGRSSDTFMTVQPVVNGVVVDFDSTEVLLRYFIRKAIGVSHLRKPRVLISVPSELPDVSRKAVQEAVIYAGARRVFSVQKALAAAIGSGLPVYEAVGHMVVDIGGGTTDAAVISMGGMVVSSSIPTAGTHMDAEIVSYLKKYSGMLIGERTAEALKKDLASAMPVAESREVQVRGRNLLLSHAMVATFTSEQAHEAVKDPCMAILNCIKRVLERTPPELSADVMNNGIYLTGGGAQLFALDQFIGSQFGLPVYVAREPEDCTIQGLGYLLQNEDLMARMSEESLS